MDTQTGTADPPVVQVAKRVLNAGSGPYSPKKLHAVFQGWDEVRLDIDPRAKPHLVSSITDMKAVIPEPAYDAIWCSHNIEHLYAHEVKPAFLEFRRVLKPGGFALITCPDIEAVAKLIVSGKFETPAYMSPAGPVAALDMVYGYSPSIEQGNVFMAHNTGFTAERLGNLLVDSGFREVWTTKGKIYDLWAVALMPEADGPSIQRSLLDCGLNFVR